VTRVENLIKADAGEHWRGVGLPAEPRADDVPPLPTLREVFRAEGGFVLRVLRRMGVPEPDLEDAGQDVFVIVHRRLSSFDRRSSLRAWLFGIASRVALARRRSAYARHERTRADLDLTESSADPSDQSTRLDARALLVNALDKLDDDKRAAFILYELEGFSMPEVSAAIGCPLQTAYSRVRVARQVVRADVERALRWRRP
jgi:RNA polymerase sigma-70 factor, ECF subfamily